jgi:hypothetical protein
LTEQVASVNPVAEAVTAVVPVPGVRVNEPLDSLAPLAMVRLEGVSEPLLEVMVTATEGVVLTVFPKAS